MTEQEQKAFDQMREALELAMENLRPHSDNCFLHDEGEYNACFCGKDSLVNHLQSVVESAALTAANAVSEQAQGEQRYLLIERVSGFPKKLETGPQPVLYSDSINGCMVRRDDVWLALTSHLNSQATEPAWRPIESAPRNGTPILLATDGGIVFVGKLNKHLQLWVDDEGRERFRTVTYWMPLPAAPEAKQ